MRVGGHRGRGLTAAGVAVVLVLGAVVLDVVVANARTTRGHGRAVHPVALRAGSPAAPLASASSASPAAPPALPTAAPTVSPRTRLDRTLAALPRGTASVAALDLDTGARYVGGDRGGHWTASVYKLLVLHLLWLSNKGWLTSAERDDAVAAIENSDNKAGYRLFLDLGGNAAFQAGIARLHLRHTVPGVDDPTFTRTSAADCVTVLRSVLSDPFALDLMRHVEADQRWGVGSVADRGDQFAVKNGWLSVDDTNGAGESDDGRWIVDSIGIVRVHGRQLLLAVLTQHNPDLESGIQLVRRLAKQAAEVVAP
jgi:hypothetical protein